MPYITVQHLHFAQAQQSIASACYTRVILDERDTEQSSSILKFTHDVLNCVPQAEQPELLLSNNKKEFRRIVP